MPTRFNFDLNKVLQSNDTPDVTRVNTRIISIPTVVFEYPINIVYSTQEGGLWRKVESLLSSIGHKTEAYTYFTIVVVNQETGATPVYYRVSLVPSQYLKIAIDDNNYYRYVFKVAPLIDVVKIPGQRDYSGIRFLKSLKNKRKVQDLAMLMGGWSVDDYVAAVSALLLALNTLAILDGTGVMSLTPGNTMDPSLINSTIASAPVAGGDRYNLKIIHVGGYGTFFDSSDVFSQRNSPGGSSSVTNPSVKITSGFRSLCTNKIYENSLNNEVASNSLHLYFRAVDFGGLLEDNSVLSFSRDYIEKIKDFLLNEASRVWFTSTLYSKIYEAISGKLPDFSLNMVFHGKKSVGGVEYPNHLHVGFIRGGNLAASSFKWRPGV